MLALVFSLLMFPVEEPENIRNLLEKARPTNAKEVRIDALTKLKNTTPGILKEAEKVCRILEQYLKEKDSEIRQQAFLALGLIAYQEKLECPLPIVEAIGDEDDLVQTNAQGLVSICTTFSKPAIQSFFKAAESTDEELRAFVAVMLPHVAGKSPEVVKKLKQMMNDPDEFVRHNAHLGHYKATDDFESHVSYLLTYSTQADVKHPIETEIQKRNQTRRNLQQLGVAMQFHLYSMERPKDLAKELIVNLSQKDPKVRQSALRQLRAMCISSHDSYQAIPKVKAQAAVKKLFDDKNETVSSWAYWVHDLLEKGPPPDAPQKIEPLDNTIDLFPQTTPEQKPPTGDKP